MSSVNYPGAVRYASRAGGEKRFYGLAGSLGLVALAVCIAIAVRIWLVQPYAIPTRSMVPLLEAGDYLLVNKTGWDWPALSRKSVAAGDVIVFRGPPSGQTYIKRVIARGGDRVALLDGRVHLNGLKIPCMVEGPGFCRERLPDGRSWLVAEDAAGPFANVREIIVPDGYIYVLGDNRGNSLDSRAHVADGGMGLVPVDHIIGRSARIFFSLDRQNGIRWQRIGQKAQ
ncbi:MAG: signal peptidase I [Sphingomonadaceae bacterium]